MKPGIRFKTIHMRIIAAILPVVFIATISLVLISYVASYDRLNHETEQKMFAILDREAVRIQGELQRNAAVAQSIVSYVQATDREVLLSGGYLKFLQSVVPTNKNTIGGGIWFEPYTLSPDIRYFGPYYYQSGGQYVLTQMYETEEYDYPNTEWYLNGKNGDGGLVWTDVYFDPLSGISMLTGAQPFYDENGTFWGTCSADMDLVDIQREIGEIRIGETGRTFLLGHHGNYISFLDEGKTLDMLITQDAETALAALGSELMATEKGASSVKREGELIRVYYQTIPGIGWKLGVCIDEAEITAPTRSLVLLMLGITLLTLAAITFFVVMLARYLRGIINRVNSFSHLAASGHLEERIDLDVTDEFKSIADNLNMMMENMGRMSRAKDDFLSRMSHEIRTPMNAIIGMAHIAKSADDPKRVDDCLEKIEDSSQHLLGIINDILDYSKAEAGKLTMDEALFSLTANMEFVLSMLHARAMEKQLELVLALRNIQYDGIYADALRLNQVLINLLSNAVKFTDAGGRIEIEVEELSHDVDGFGVYRFSVCDNGIGIAPEQVEKLFSPFEQGSASIGSRYGGTGLGLVISKNIVEKMGGKFSLESTPGQGSTFSFTIRVKAQPHAKESGNPKSAAPMETPDFSGKRILIVDDIQINREIILELLAPSGIAMETAEDGRQAVDAFLNAPEGYFDIILMDMQMPVLDGCDATREIRASEKPDAQSIKILAMTANVMKEDIERTKQAGMNGHIGKPIDINEMYRQLGLYAVKGGNDTTTKTARQPAHLQ